MEKREYGVFVTEPAYAHTIYHLSLDDKRALCGRDASKMEYLGETKLPTNSIYDISVMWVNIWRCCEQCREAYNREARQ